MTDKYENKMEMYKLKEYMKTISHIAFILHKNGCTNMHKCIMHVHPM